LRTTAPGIGPFPGEIKALNSLIHDNLLTIRDLLQALNIIIFTVSGVPFVFDHSMLCIISVSDLPLPHRIRSGGLQYFHDEMF